MVAVECAVVVFAFDIELPVLLNAYQETVVVVVLCIAVDMCTAAVGSRIGLAIAAVGHTDGTAVTDVYIVVAVVG